MIIKNTIKITIETKIKNHVHIKIKIRMRITVYNNKYSVMQITKWSYNILNTSIN